MKSRPVLTSFPGAIGDTMRKCRYMIKAVLHPQAGSSQLSTRCKLKLAMKKKLDKRCTYPYCNRLKKE